jgi:hypothetical protein
MLERLSRLAVGVGVVWVVIVVGLGLLAGLDKPAAWARLLDDVLSPDLRQGVYFALALLVVPLGMLTVIRDVWSDPTPLWLKLAAPGALAAVYVLFLAAALPGVGQPLLRSADPLASRLVSGSPLTVDPADAWSWLVRFGAMLLLLAGLPGGLGLLVGLLAGGPRRR